MKILITGFDPFAGESINPALEAVKMLPSSISGCDIVKLEIPTIFKKSVNIIEENIIKHRPDIVISIGQATGRFGVTPERVAINLDDAIIKDNDGNQPIDKKISIDGPDAYFSTLPLKAMVEEMKKNDIPATISNTAGTFVCNHVMYSVLHLINTKKLKIRAGFIHVPAIPRQVINKSSIPCMNINDIVRGLEISIKVIIENQEDLKKVGGEVC
ncbi:MAG: pyroglutamyl-peptidase I [Paraclostridium sp.]|uniref:pyroglutamyl-peptidase I n=1 Tax=Paraclostridium sp. TaxID=2023273 RepID=UPI003F33EC5C